MNYTPSKPIAGFRPVTLDPNFNQFISQPPTYEDALAFLQSKYGSKRATPEHVREWYDFMDAVCWCDQNGHAVRNWPMWYYRWDVNYARFAALRAVPDPALESCGGKTPIRAHSIGKEALDALDQIL